MNKLKPAFLGMLVTGLLITTSLSGSQAAEEQIFIEDLTPTQLRTEIEKIEKEFYRVFNASIDDKKLTIICHNYLATGTNIKEEVCEPQFTIDKRARNANDSRFGIEDLWSPRRLQRELSIEYEKLEEAMNKVAEGSEYFRELNSILGALKEELAQR